MSIISSRKRKIDQEKMLSLEPSVPSKKPTTTRPSLLSLPLELLLRIFSFLDDFDLSIVSGVNRVSYKVAADEELWKRLWYTFAKLNLACSACRWSTKKHQSLRLHPKVDYTTLLDALSQTECREILSSRSWPVKNETLADLRRLVASTTPPFCSNMVWAGKWYVV